jgi:small conductance mechanosensitive channel
VINFISRQGSRRLDIMYRFGNAVDIREAKKVIDGTIVKEERCLKTPEHRIGVSLLEADSFTLSISVWVNAHGFEDTRLILQEAILQDLKDAGIKIGGL